MNKSRIILKKGVRFFMLSWMVLGVISCSQPQKSAAGQPSSAKTVAKKTSPEVQSSQGKAVVYQVFTRLFGNKKTTNKPWGTLKENGVGKFNDFTDTALKGIKEFGVTHIWYTGVLHHALVGDYTQYGISNDDPDVVKGRAGSPYAVKDYYNVNPDLAIDPANRLAEFESLIARTHSHGMKVIIDIVPNHIARSYQSLSKPEGVGDFGSGDDSSVEYHKHNNFYYVVDQDFEVPEPLDNYRPLGGDKNTLIDNKFLESPAKWTGNGSRKAQPHFHDWYETVKVNYGVRPDGSYDFARLPAEYHQKGYKDHLEFWSNKEIPDSWKKFRDIALYWIDKGVDGFRYDMAEMVPVEFWSYLNSSIKQKNANAFLLAEVYNPEIYRDYIFLGKMDYLYDKVDFYDTLKLIMQGKSPTSNLLPVIDKVSDIDGHMLHFLENHDEQRIASPDFAGDANMGKPAMVVSALIGKSPTMLYFAQALGETGEGDAGFGRASRTTIFDYWGISSLQRWMNGGKFDGGKLFEREIALRKFYTKLLSFSSQSQALKGHYKDLHKINIDHAITTQTDYDENLFAFARWSEEEKLIVVSSFSNSKNYQFSLKVPAKLISAWRLKDGIYPIHDILNDSSDDLRMVVEKGSAMIDIHLSPLTSSVLKLN